MEPEEYRVLVSQGARLLDVKVPGHGEDGLMVEGKRLSLSSLSI